MNFRCGTGNIVTCAFGVFMILLCHQKMFINSQIIDCAGLMMRVAKGILRIYAQCSKDFMQSLDNNELEYHRRIDCVFKCVMDDVGLLDEIGKVTNDTMQVFFDKFIPEDYHEIGHIMVEGCIEEWSPLMDHNDEDDTCVPYGEFIKCVQSIVADAC